MDGINDMVFVVSVENNPFTFTYDFLNRAAMEGTGFTERILGKPIREVYQGEEGTFLYEQYKQAANRGEIVSYEDSYVSPLGEKCYSETKLTPLLDEEEYCYQIVAVVKDTTKMKWAELEKDEAWSHLNESNNRYQSLFHHNPDAIISFDLNGLITNGLWKKLLVTHRWN